MIDLNQYIFDLLTGVINVTLEYPESTPEFPCAVINEIYNASTLITDRQENLSNISYQIDVWDNSESLQLCEQKAQKIDEIMISNGFRRDECITAKQDGLHKKTMRYNANIINRRT